MLRKAADMTVKVSSDTRSPDWAWQRSRRMHAENAAAIDRRTARHAAKMAAKAEKSARKRAR